MSVGSLNYTFFIIDRYHYLCWRQSNKKIVIWNLASPSFPKKINCLFVFFSSVLCSFARRLFSCGQVAFPGTFPNVDPVQLICMYIICQNCPLQLKSFVYKLLLSYFPQNMKHGNYVCSDNFFCNYITSRFMTLKRFSLIPQFEKNIYSNLIISSSAVYLQSAWLSLIQLSFDPAYLMQFDHQELFVWDLKNITSLLKNL